MLGRPGETSMPASRADQRGKWSFHGAQLSRALSLREVKHVMGLLGQIDATLRK